MAAAGIPLADLYAAPAAALEAPVPEGTGIPLADFYQQAGAAELPDNWDKMGEQEKKGFWANLHPWESLKSDNLFQQLARGTKASGDLLLRQAEGKLTTSIESLKPDPTALEGFKQLYDQAKKDPGKFGAELANQLAAHPEYLAIPMGGGVLSRAAVGAAIGGTGAATEKFAETGTGPNPSELAVGGTMGAALGAIMPGGRGKPKPAEKPAAPPVEPNWSTSDIANMAGKHAEELAREQAITAGGRPDVDIGRKQTKEVRAQVPDDHQFATYLGQRASQQSILGKHAPVELEAPGMARDANTMGEPYRAINDSTITEGGVPKGGPPPGLRASLPSGTIDTQRTILGTRAQPGETGLAAKPRPEFNQPTNLTPEEWVKATGMPYKAGRDMTAEELAMHRASGTVPNVMKGAVDPELMGKMGVASAAAIALLLTPEEQRRAVGVGGLALAGAMKAHGMKLAEILKQVKTVEDLNRLASAEHPAHEITMYEHKNGLIEVQGVFPREGMRNPLEFARAIQTITQGADRLGRPMFALAQPGKGAGIGLSRLEKYYEGFGFQREAEQPIQGATYMYRPVGGASKETGASTPEHLIKVGATAATLAGIGYLAQHPEWQPYLRDVGTLLTGGALAVMAPRALNRLAMGPVGASAQMGAVKPKGGMWHPEAVERLARPLIDKLVDSSNIAGANLAKAFPERFNPDGSVKPEHARSGWFHKAWSDEKAKVAAEQGVWPVKAVRTYLNRHAGTEGDPLKDLVLPSGERWETQMDKAISDIQKTEKGMLSQGREGEPVWSVDEVPRGWNNVGGDPAAGREISSYISHMGDFARQNISPAKLPQYDFVRLAKETAQNDARVAKEMEKASLASTKDLPVYKDYPGTGMKWVELKLPEKLTEEQKKGVKKVPAGETPEGYEYVATDEKGKAVQNSYTQEPAYGKTPEEAHLAGQLAQEGNQMGHCVGGYCEGVASGESRILSLRDERGQSHVTVELEKQQPRAEGKDWSDFADQRRIGGEQSFDAWMQKNRPEKMIENVRQIKGKQNRAPVDKYLPFVQDLVKSGKWGEVGDLENTGLHNDRQVFNFIEDALEDAVPRNAQGAAEPGTRAKLDQIKGRLRAEIQEHTASGRKYWNNDELVKLEQKYGVQPDKNTRWDSSKPNGELGSIDPKLLARIAAFGLGGVAGQYLNPENLITGAILGGLGGIAAARFLSPVGVVRRAVQAVQEHKLPHVKDWIIAGIPATKEGLSPDTRMRITPWMKELQTNRNKAFFPVWQLTQKMRADVSSARDRETVLYAREAGDLSKLTPAQRVLAADLGKFYDQWKKEGLSAGVLKSVIDENYVTHMWDLSTPAARSLYDNLVSKRATGDAVGLSTPFSKRRVGPPTLAEGEAAGLKPMTKDPAVLAALYAQSMIKAIENTKFNEAIKAAKSSDGTRMAVTPKEQKGAKPYAGYEYVKNSGLFVHPDIVPSMRFVYDNVELPSMIRGMLAANMIQKRLGVSLSAFHAKALMDAFIGAKKITWPVVAGGVVGAALNPGDPVSGAQWGAGGMMAALGAVRFGKFALGSDQVLKSVWDGTDKDLICNLYDGGVEFTLKGMETGLEDVNNGFYNAMRSVQKTMDSVIPYSGKVTVGTYTAVNHAVDELMWGRLQAGGKITIFAEKYAELLKNNAAAHAKNPNKVPLKSEKEIAGIAGSFTNDLFGSLNWMRIAEDAKTRWGRDIALSAMSPMGRKGMQLLLFAPDWTISTTRAAVNAFGQGSGWKGLLKPQELADLHRQYIARQALYAVTLYDALNVSLSGHHIWQNKDWTSVDRGDGTRIQISKHSFEPIHWLQKPTQQAMSKLAYVPKMAGQALTGTEYLSATGHAPPMKESFPVHALKEFASPIAAQQFESGAQRGLLGAIGMPVVGMSKDDLAKARLERRQRGNTPEELERKRLRRLEREDAKRRSSR